MKGRPKAGLLIFVGPGLVQLILAPKSQAKEKKKERGGRKEEERKKKAMVALLVFIMATMMASFGLKNENCHVDKIIRLA